MDLSKAVAALALAAAAVLITDYSRAYGQEAARETVAAREAARRIALAEHQRRKEDVARLCAKPVKTNTEMDACRAAYRRL